MYEGVWPLPHHISHVSCVIYEGVWPLPHHISHVSYRSRFGHQTAQLEHEFADFSPISMGGGAHTTPSASLVEQHSLEVWSGPIFINSSPSFESHATMVRSFETWIMVPVSEVWIFGSRVRIRRFSVENSGRTLGIGLLTVSISLPPGQ